MRSIQALISPSSATMQAPKIVAKNTELKVLSLHSSAKSCTEVGSEAFGNILPTDGYIGGSKEQQNEACQVATKLSPRLDAGSPRSQ